MRGVLIGRFLRLSKGGWRRTLIALGKSGVQMLKFQDKEQVMEESEPGGLETSSKWGLLIGSDRCHRPLVLTESSLCSLRVHFYRVDRCEGLREARNYSEGRQSGILG